MQYDYNLVLPFGITKAFNVIINLLEKEKKKSLVNQVGANKVFVLQVWRCATCMHAFGQVNMKINMKN